MLALTTSETNRLKRLALMSGYGLLIAFLVIPPLLPLWPGWDNWAVLQAGSGAGQSLLVVPPALALLWPISRSPKSEV